MRQSTHNLYELFYNALRFNSDDERRAYLERVCRDDPQSLRKVTAMLEDHFADGSPTRANPAPQQTSFVVSSEESPGTLIGPYKIRETLGEGGMGIVYLAEQSEPVHRKVALKIIKPGMDSRSVIARFEAERQALAMMSHPNIARILDGGATEQGRPYFVMEVVRGIPIHEYCDQHQLPIRERLRLFIAVCEAVQHAHMKGIIHRDLKPTNILVEQQGETAVPKIIDFGIAKALDQRLTQETVYTQFAQLIGTPEYMSPEQARLSEIDIDTRSDIYSLGVILYELLTGMLPYQVQPDSRIGFDEIRRIISEDEPRRPSQKLSTLENENLTTVSRFRSSDPKHLTLSMKRELDWIALKSLEKDRSRRYQSATALAEDLQRYLDHEPVLACPPSFTYRLRKLLYQNRTFLLAATVVVMSALAGTAVSIWYASEARRARQHAEELLYATDMNLAGEFWKDGDWRSLAEILDRYHDSQRGTAGLRGFEWWFLYNLSTGDSHLLDARDEQGCLARYSPDGRYVALGWTDGRIDLRDAQTHEFLFSLEGNGSFVNGCDFHPEQNRLATIADDSRLRVWNLDTRELLLEIKAAKGHGYRVFFSRDGQTLVTSGEEGRVRFWNAETGEPEGEIGGFSQQSHSGVEERMDCCASRGWLAIADGDGAAAIYDFQTREKLVDLQGVTHHNSLRCLRFSTDGRYVAGSKNSRDVCVWRTDKGEQIARFEGHLDDVQDLVFYPDNRWLLTCDRTGVIHRWPLNETEEPTPSAAHRLLHASAAFRDHTDRIWSMDFSNDGSALITGSRDNTFRIWTDDEERSHRHVPVDSPSRISYVGDGNLLIADGDQLNIWNRKSGEIRLLAEAAAPVARLCVSEPEELAATLDDEGRIQLWALNSGELRSSFQAPGRGHHYLSMSADGKRVVSAAYLSSLVNIWDEDSSGEYQLIESIGGKQKSDLARFDGAWLAPDGRTVVLHQLNELHLFQPRSGKINQIFQNHTNRVYTVAFSRDGKLMASGSNDRTVCIWEFATGRLQHCMAAHKNEVNALAFSPDGLTLVSGDEDGTIVFTQVSTGRALFETRIEDGKILDLEFSPDGQTLAVLQPESLILLSGARN